MIVTSPAAVGLVRAILEDPFDDVPRLLLADVLEEAGEGERAEFIRVQIALAGMTGVDPACRKKWPFGRHSSTCGEVPCAECWPGRDTLRRRERELIGLRGHEWAREGLNDHWGYDAEALYYWHDLQNGSASHPIPIIFRRGFVASVTLTCADWWGAVCPVCSGWRSREAYCNHCNGTSRTGRHGPALVLAAPIEEVVLGGVQPREVRSASGSRWWFVGDTHVPAELLNLANQSGIGIPPGHTTPQVALAALFRAALAWARQEAGLPALP
jgi:uncharacterized protein (TIGR02996 family)